MHRNTSVAVLLLGLFLPAASGHADLTRITPSQPDVSVGQRFELALKLGFMDGGGNMAQGKMCAYDVRIAAPSGSGLSEQIISVEMQAAGSDYKVSYPEGLLNRFGWEYKEYQWPDRVVIEDLKLFSPGSYQISVVSKKEICRVKAPPVYINVREDYSPLSISIYGLPNRSAVRALDGSWRIVPGEKKIWITKTADSDLKFMTDSYVPGAWQQIFPAAFERSWSDAGVTLARVEKKAWNTLSEAGWSNDSDLLVLALGYEQDVISSLVAEGRLVKLLEFSPEVFVQPLKKAAEEATEARARLQANSGRLGDPATLVGFRITSLPEQPKTGR